MRKKCQESSPRKILNSHKSIQAWRFTCPCLWPVRSQVFTDDHSWIILSLLVPISFTLWVLLQLVQQHWCWCRSLRNGHTQHKNLPKLCLCLSDETEHMKHLLKRQVLTFLSRLFKPQWLHVACWQDSVLWHYPEQGCHGINSLTFTFPGELAIWGHHMRRLPSQPKAAWDGQPASKSLLWYLGSPDKAFEQISLSVTTQDGYCCENRLIKWWKMTSLRWKTNLM